MPLVVNFVAFQVGWFSSVIGGAQQLPWLGPVVALLVVGWHLMQARRPMAELTLVVGCGLIGAVFDSVLVALGWVSYPSGMLIDVLAPYWIVTMWMLFATTLNMSLRWLKGRPALASILGLVAGPAAYWAGHKLGGVEFVDPVAALVALGAGWAVLLPLLMPLARTFDGMSPEPASERLAGLPSGG